MTGAVAHVRGQYDRAVALYERALARQRALGEKWLAANLCSNLGWVRLRQGDPERARGHFREARALAEELANPPLLAMVALGGAGVLATRGDPTTAAALWGRPSRSRRGTGRSCCAPTGRTSSGCKPPSAAGSARRRMRPLPPGAGS